MPEEALLATKAFLNMERSSTSDFSDHYGSYLAKGVQDVEKSYYLLRNKLAPMEEPELHANSSDSADDTQTNSSLLKVIMDGYNKAVKERDEALASLATTSIMNDNQTLQYQLQMGSGEPRRNNKGSSDEDVLNLCKQLGNEIALRTAAETEINRLNERLDFEQKCCKAKEDELRNQMSKYENASQNRF